MVSYVRRRTSEQRIKTWPKRIAVGPRKVATEGERGPIRQVYRVAVSCKIQIFDLGVAGLFLGNKDVRTSAAAGLRVLSHWIGNDRGRATLVELVSCP